MTWILGHISEVVNILILIGVGLLTLSKQVREWFLTKLNFRAERSEIIKNTKLADAEGSTTILELLDVMDEKIAELQAKVIKDGQHIARLSRKINSYENGFHKLKMLCDIICDKSDICKQKIQEVFDDIKNSFHATDDQE